MARNTDVIIIGGGQAGLATSRCISDVGIDHVVLERGAVAERWRSERWNSLRLLTPNWMTRLPGWSYQGDDPHGFMHKNDVAEFLTGYGADFSAPVMCQTRVLSAHKTGAGFEVKTTAGNLKANAVVIATGACDRPKRPEFSGAITPKITQLTLDTYKSPDQIAAGGVLVVGASASGIQIASELQTIGRQVTLATGQHTRVPRRYRGCDILFWLDQCRVLNELRDPGVNLHALAEHNSLQLIGSQPHKSLDLGVFQKQGGKVCGRMVDAAGSTATFANNLTTDINNAEIQLNKILHRIDTFIKQHHLKVPDAAQIAPVCTPTYPSQINLLREGIKTIIWATGYARDYSWLGIPVLSQRGEILQQGGITPIRGLYTMGLPFMRRRNSTFIDGVGQDAHEITRHLARHLGLSIPKAA